MTQTPQQNQNPNQGGPKKFERDRENGMIFGLCAGIANYANIDINMVRFLTVISIFFTGSLTFWAYFFGAVFVPYKESGEA